MNVYKYIKTLLLGLNKERRDKLSHQQREILLYVFFGALTTLISLATYFLFRWLLSGATSSTSPAVVISWVCAVTFAFITNKLFVFKSRRKSVKSAVLELFSFYGARFLTLMLDLLLMFLLVDLTGYKGGWYEFFARAFVGCVVLVVNYLLSKIFIFKKPH